ncbi:MAG: aminoglycoside phosphotransferase family protein [Caldilineaceae bacterium]
MVAGANYGPLTRTSAKLDESAETVLIHGDLHFDNILWDGQNIAAILDFEKAFYAPPEVELDLFLRYCAFPQLFVQEEYEHLTHAADYDHVPFWFADAYPGLFQVDHLVERLRMYSLAYDLSLLRQFPPKQQVDSNIEDELLNRLRAVVEQTGYLFRLTQKLQNRNFSIKNDAIYAAHDAEDTKYLRLMKAKYRQNSR